jgi:hypothetical protein
METPAQSRKTRKERFMNGHSMPYPALFANNEKERHNGSSLSIIVNNPGYQRGAVLPLTAICLAGLCGLASLAVDVGMMFYARQQAQNKVDAASLAGAQLLPARDDASRAHVTAVVNAFIAASNTGSSSLIKTAVSFPTTVKKDDGTTVTVPEGYAIKVDGYVDAPMSFSPVVGFSPVSVDGVTKNARSIPAHATCASFGPPSTMPAGTDSIPIGIIGDDPNSSNPDIAFVSRLLTTAPNSDTPQPGVYQSADKIFTLKAGVSGGTGGTSGNYGALDIDGSGGSNYQQGLASYSKSAVNVGDVVATETGDLVGPTKQGIDARLAPTNTLFSHHYSSYVDWFFGDPSLPIDNTMAPVTDPSTGAVYYYHQDPNRQDKSDAHIMVVPIITSSSKSGKNSVTILGFGVFFLETTQPGGGGSVISGRFIGMAVPGATGGTGTSPGAGALDDVSLVA